jgi:hypothetical protein
VDSGELGAGRLDSVPDRGERFLSSRHSLYIDGLDGWILFPAGARIFSSRQRPDRLWYFRLLSNRYETHFPGVTRPVREADHSPLSRWSYTCTSL